jgi:hypothetical protein
MRLAQKMIVGDTLLLDRVANSLLNQVVPCVRTAFARRRGKMTLFLWLLERTEYAKKNELVASASTRADVTLDKVENLAKEYLAELKEVDLTFEKGTAVLEKYRAKYPELASYIREVVPGERRIEIRQRLEGEDVSLHLFAIRVLEDEARYEVKLSGGQICSFCP